MMKKLILVLVLLFCICSSGNAANTITFTGQVIEITAIDADWLWSSTLPSAANVDIISIQFIPGAADDHCVILNGSASSATIFDVLAVDAYDARVLYFPRVPAGGGLKPFLDVSEGNYNANAKVIITLGAGK